MSRHLPQHHQHNDGMQAKPVASRGSGDEKRHPVAASVQYRPCRLSGVPEPEPERRGGTHLVYAGEQAGGTAGEQPIHISRDDASEGWTRIETCGSGR